MRVHSIFKMLVVGALVFASAVSCSKKKIVKNPSYSVTANTAADELVDIGEQLMGGSTFMLADKMFMMALEKEPGNVRAQFYHAFLGPWMAHKGLGSKFKPLVRRFGDIKKWEKWQNDTPSSHMKGFLIDGKEEIETVEGGQVFQDNIKESWAKLRIFLRDFAKSNSEIVLKVNPEIFRDAVKAKLKESCVVQYVDADGSPIRTTDADGKPLNTKMPTDAANMRHEDLANGSHFDIVCDYKNLLLEKLNSADITALQQMAAGWELYYSILNSYTLEGVQYVDWKANDLMSVPERQKNLEAQANMGLLRANNFYSIAKELGADMRIAAKFVLENQQTLCETGNVDAINRRGYLFRKGFCILPADIDAVKKAIDMELAAADHEIVTPVIDVHQSRVAGHAVFVDTRINVPYLLANPIKNLRSVAPTGYNECPHRNGYSEYLASGLRDNTMGGLYPDGDVMKIVTTECDQDEDRLENAPGVNPKPLRRYRN